MKKAGKIIALVSAGIILIVVFRFLWNNSSPESPVYEIISPQTGDIQNTTTATGNIEPRNEVALKPEISGIVSEIFKETGQKVRTGEVIASLKIITEIKQLKEAESRLQIAEIALEQVTKEYERQTMLFENHVIARNEYEVAEANYRKTVEEKNTAEDVLEIVKIGTSKRSNSVNNTLIHSRIAGTILDIPVKEGNSVISANAFNDGTTIAIIANMDDLIFKGTLDETEVGKITTGMPVFISIGAVNHEAIKAVLEYIAPKGEKKNGSVLYEIKAAIQTPNISFIRANYSANADIILEQVENVITIPESSIEFDRGTAYVYVLENNKSKPVFTKKQIETGLSDGIIVEVKSGLNLSDKIRGIKIDSSVE
ncbi:RND transporter MFP subunit [Bacteroidia bacterium]|nr:RND transporter MFP subunit [Bacteroidia bacterium]